jgi:AcrR family transcriptional regulator
LQHHALRLFTQRGFDAVTVEDVAAAAGVSHMTFYRHFPTKESVVLEDPYDPLIGEAIRQQDPSSPPLQRVVAGMMEAWSRAAGLEEEQVRLRLRLAIDHPGLRARAWENNRATEVVVVDALTATGVAELEARVVAGAVLGALTAALFDWAEQDDASLGDWIVRALTLLGATAEGVG